MLNNNIEMSILVKNRPIAEYQHEGKTFVEGRAGSEYAILINNHSYQRVEAVLSVDGLSVIDGKPAGPHSQGYLIGSRGNISIPGWMLDSQAVAKFAFSATQRSYTAQSGEDVHNNGVIGLMAFREKLIPQYPVMWSAAASPLRGFSTSATGYTSGGFAGTLSNVSNSISPSAEAFVSQNLGTAFGEATQFATHTVMFERGDSLATLLCYYDSLKGLRARGVPIERRKKVTTVPNAFPAGGCRPPPGWQG